MWIDNSFQRIPAALNGSGSLLDQFTFIATTSTFRISQKCENPIKMLIIRLNVAVKNNYPKLSGIKRKLLKCSAL